MQNEKRKAIDLILKTGGSEFRKDIVSGDWILVAPLRKKRPGSREFRKVARKISVEKTCPFENPPSALLSLGKDGRVSSGSSWFVKIVSNKYPALLPHKICPRENFIKPYSTLSGVGWHEVVITRGHKKTIADYSAEETEILLRAYQERYLQLSDDACVKYILIFHNFGERAGASIYHPHSQIIALPIIPPDVSRSLGGSENYFKENGRCVHCAILEFEKKEKARVIYENADFMAVAPFASRLSFETRIYPKKHSPNFESISGPERLRLAESFRFVLARFKINLGDPDYNFFIHTAPVRPKNFRYYHWHIEILPRLSLWAGLELGTGIQIVAVSPEEAAVILKNQKS